MDHTTTGDDVRRSAESTVATIAEQAQQTAEAHVSTQKDQAAGALHSVAEAVRRSSDQLRDEQPQLASLASQAAERVDDVSDYIRQHEVRDFVRTAEDFARREPLIFLGGAFAVGFLAARFLKASSPNQGMAGGNGSWSRDDGRIRYAGNGGGAGAYRQERSLGISEPVGAGMSGGQADYQVDSGYTAEADRSSQAELDEQAVGGTNARRGS